MQDRDITLDVAKGLAIILVVIGHSFQYSFGPQYTASKLFFADIPFKSIYSFHMPLFMLISGYLFYNSNKKDFKSLILSKLKRIGIPFVTFTLLCNVTSYLSFLKKGEILNCLTSCLSQIFQGVTIWFLFALLLNMLVVSIITRVCKKKPVLYAVMFLLFIGSMFIPDTIVLDIHKSMFPFFCIGYIIKENNVDIYKYSKNLPLLIIATILSIGCIIWFNYDTYIYTTGYCIYDNYLQILTNFKRILIALVISFTFMQYVHLLSQRKQCRLLVYFAQISLFIYGVNIFIDTMYSRLFLEMGWNFEYNYISPILFTIGTIGVACLLYKLVSKNRVTNLLFLGQ